MAISKKPRKRPKVSSPKGASSTMELTNPEVMKLLMSALAGPEADDAVSAAQDVIYDAWDQSSKRARINLARKALKISPLCADAYVLLAEEDAKSPEEVLEYYRKGVEAGKQALGPEAFEEYRGHFWGVLETRPYMRARAGLAAALDASGDADGAIDHYQDMLRLNPNDNQGIRYILAGCLMKHGHTEALKELFRNYDEDGSALWLFSRALAAFRENGAADKRANALAKEALRANRHVQAVLSGSKKAKPSKSPYLSVGGEDEAAYYVEEWGSEWFATPGAIDWLTSVTAERVQTGAKRRSRH